MLSRRMIPLARAPLGGALLSSFAHRAPAARRGLPGPIALARPIVVQRRFLLGPFFRLARSGIAVTAGAAAGGVAYANHKLSEATSSVSDKFDKATGWFGDMWDKLDISFPQGSGGGPGAAQHGTASTAAGPGANSDAGAFANNGGDPFVGGSNGGSGTGAGSGGSGGAAGGAGGSSSGGSGGDEAAAVLGAAGSNALSADAEDPLETDDDVEWSDKSQMIGLTRKMIEVRNLLLQVNGENSVQIPSIVVIGSQSSGKSSVLEALVGHEFLPKGANMVTRRPIELTLVHTTARREFCEFPTLGLGQMTDFQDVQKTLTDLNRAVSATEVVSDEPIQLRINSPHVPDLTLIDLPGYIQVVAADQPLELKSRIAALCERYIQPPNIILAVSAADVDLANSTALRASRKVDPEGRRTIGVITKMDLVDAGRGVATLLNREYPLRMGYVGVVTRVPPQQQRGVASQLFGKAKPVNQTRLVARREAAFFGGAEYAKVNWGVLRLREILQSVLEKSMADSLEPTQRNIRTELEETAYTFKVQFNDRVLTPQTYLAQSADSFKVAFQELAAKFGRDQVRDLIKQSLDQKVLDQLAESYWNAPPGMSPRSGYSNILADRALMHRPELTLADMSASKPDMLAWQHKIDDLSASLTKLGVGRLSTLILVGAIRDRMNQLVADSPFCHSALAINEINDAMDKILSTKFYATADQIENSIKPYKYEIEMDAREWQQSREYACSLLKEEYRQCQSAYRVLEAEVGSSKLNKLVKAVGTAASTENLDHFSGSLLAKVRTAAFLRERMDILQARTVFVRSSKCKSSKHKALCPEVFMDVVANKLAATSVLFLNFELLSDFYYSFPRALDAKLQSLNEQQVEAIATQDPLIKKQIDLQHRKELLQLALTKLQSISDLRSIEESVLQ